ncbi:S-adenosyl-L-methionine-dependent methyltransferase [Pelagophyceae sp. CCMP2097]|nr:S-adenosyl-L-methionine-dependent methyltransferase [Pelagophyceae sp. CCMP2097]
MRVFACGAALRRVRAGRRSLSYSYQHGYHAGSFADVHKHVAYALILAELTRGAAATVIDAFAGRGAYDLRSATAARTDEWKGGVGRVAAESAAPASDGLRRYVDAVRNFDDGGGPANYPGSPALAATLLRAGDSLVLLEQHPAEHLALRATMDRLVKRPGYAGPRITVRGRPCDAFDDDRGVLGALLDDGALDGARPGVLLVDPAYELRPEYARVGAFVDGVLEKWPAAAVVVWYPILGDSRHNALLDGLGRSAPTLIAELRTGAQPRRTVADGGDDAYEATPRRGLVGTGLAVVNAPASLEASLGAAGAEICAICFGDAGTHSVRPLGPAPPAPPVAAGTGPGTPIFTPGKRQKARKRR